VIQHLHELKIQSFPAIGCIRNLLPYKEQLVAIHIHPGLHLAATLSHILERDFIRRHNNILSGK
jgi:hypothetical protein